MRVAGLQLDIVWEDPAENFRRAALLAGQAAAGGAELVVLPEMFATGFSMAAAAVVAHADRTLDFLCELATRCHCRVIGGLAVPHSPRPLNACVLIDRDGSELARYHKIHPFSLAHEPEHYDAGSSLTTFALDGLRITPLICYDLRFPELFRLSAEATDLYVVIANWPTTRGHHWRSLLEARAIDCLAWVLGVNRVGCSADGHHHRGDTSLVDPSGLVIAQLAEQAGVVLGEVDANAVQTVRARLRFLADRRPELYAALEHGNTKP